MHRLLDADWQPGPEAPQLHGERVDIWRLDLARAVCARSQGGRASGAWRTAAHQARGDILARYLGQPTEQLVLGIHPGGKPYLKSPTRALAFNLSHCRSVGLLAVGTGLDLGVDIEAPRPIADPLRLARRVMADPDIRQLEGLSRPAQDAVFFELWTRLEAQQKALGRGVFAPPVSDEQVVTFGFRPDATHVACLAVAPCVSPLSVRLFDYQPS